MPPVEQDWAEVMVQLAAIYGFRPWDVERLSEQQLTMYLRGIPSARLLRDLPMLQYSYSKVSDEGVAQILEDAARPTDPTAPPTLRQQGWRAFIRSYLTESEEAQAEISAPALKLSPAAAQALVSFAGSELMRYPTGSLFWRLRLAPKWDGLLAAAKLD